MAPPFKPRSDLQRAASSELNVKRNSIRPTKLTFETPKRPAKTPTPAPAPHLTTPRLPSAPPSVATPRRSTAATAPLAPPSTPSANPALARLAPTLAAHIHPTPRAHLNATPAPRAGGPRFESHVRWRELDKGNLAAWLGHVLEVRVGGEGLAGASAKKVVVGMAALERERVGGMMEGFRNEIEDGRVQVQEGVKLRTDDGLRTKVVRLLVSSYEPAWLLPCLAVVLRETRCLDLASLSDFPRDEAVVGHIETVLRERLLGDNLDVRRYIAPLADRLTNPVSLTDDVFNATVLDVLFTIILLLDAAKVSAATATAPPSVLPGANDPPLFRHAAALTTSDDVATKLAALLVKTSNGLGNFRRDLRAVGYKLSYTVPAYEAARGFRVPDNIETGLRDGAVLCKLASLLSRDRAILHELVDPASLSSAGSRKEVESACRTNLRLALRSFKRTSETSVNYQQQLKYDWPSASRPLAEGDLDATIALVWRVEELWVSERVIGDFAAVKSEVARLHRVFRKDRESQKEEVNGGGGLTARRRRKAELQAVLDDSPSYIDNFEIHCDGSGSHEVLAWVSAVGLFYGKKVREWTESFRDGSILCLLIHHYYPDQMAREEIKSVLWAEGRGNDETKSNEAAFARANFDMFSDAAALLGGIPYLPVSVSAALAPEFASDDKPKSFGHQMQLLASYLFARCVSFKPITDEEEDLFSELESSSLTPHARNSLQEAEEESERRLEAMIQAMQDDAARDAADYTRSQLSYNSAASATQSAVPPLRITIDDASDRPSEFSRWNQKQLVAARYIESFVTSCYLRNQYKQKQKAVATITFRRRVAQAFRIHARWAAAANTIQAAWIARQSRECRSKSNALRGPLTSYVSRRDWAMTESLAQTIQAKKVAMKSASDFPTAVISRGYETEQEGACAVLQMTYRGMASRRMESARLLEEKAQAEAMEVARLEKILEERTAHLAKREKGQSVLDSRALLSFTILQALSAGRAAFCENMSVYDAFAARACQDSILQATAAADLQQRYESTKAVQLADVAKDQRTAAKMSQYVQALETNLGRLEDELKHEKESADDLQSLLTEMRTTQVILESDGARRKLEKKEADVHEKFLADSTREMVEYQTRFVDLARERIDRLHEAARRTEISHELDEKARFSCRIRDLELALELAETACEKRRQEHQDEIVACTEKAEYVDSNRSMFDDAVSPADTVDDKLESLLRSVAEAQEKDRNSAFFSFPAGLFLQSDYGRDVACSGSSAASDELFQGPDLFVAWSAEKDKIEHSAVKADMRERKLDALMENEIHHIALQRKRAEAVARNLDGKAQASFARRQYLERLRICFEKASLTCASAKSSYDGQVDLSESDIAVLDQCRDIALRQVDEESDLNWLKSLSQELSKADACESKWDAFYATVPDATFDLKILSVESSDDEDLDAGRYNSYDDWCSAKEKLAESTNVARNRNQELDDLIARSLDERVNSSLLQRELSAKQKGPLLEAAAACVVAESSYQEQVEHEEEQVAILEQRRALAIEQNIAETIYVPLTPLVGDIALAAEINSELDVCFSSFPTQRGSVENTGMVSDTIQSPMAAEDALLDSAQGWPLGIGVDRWGESDGGIGKVADDGFDDAWSAERDSIAQSALIAGKRSNELDDQLYHEMVEVRAMQREQASAHGRLLDDAATSSLMRRDRRDHLEASSAAADVLYQTAQAEYDECVEECKKQLESLEQSRPYALDHVVDQVSDIRLSSLISELSQADEDSSSFCSVFTSNWESLLLTDGDCGDFDACILDDVDHDSAIGAFGSAWSAARSKVLASDASAQKRRHELDGLITSEELVLKVLQGKKAEELSRELDAKAVHSLFRRSARAEAKLAFENATAANNRARAEYVEFVKHMKIQNDTMVENEKLAIDRNLNAEKRNISLFESLLHEVSQADDFNSRLNRYFSILPETYWNDAVEYEEAVMDDSDANLESGDKGTGVESRDIFDAWCDAKKRLEQSAATEYTRLEQLSNLPEEEKDESSPENMLAANFASRSAKCEETNNVTPISSRLSGHGGLVFPVDHINQKSASGVERSAALSSAKLGACPKPVGIGEKSLVSMFGERGGLLSHVEGIERNNLTGSEDTVVDDEVLQSVEVEDYPKSERSGEDEPIGSPRNGRSDGFSVVAEVNEYGECLEENTVIARAAMRGAKCGGLQRPFKIEEESLKSRHSNECSELLNADGRNTATVMTALNQEEMPVSFSNDGFPSSRNSDRLLISLTSEHNLQEVSKPGQYIYSQKDMEKSSPDPAPCRNSLEAAASVGEASFCEQMKIQQDTLAANLFDDHDKCIMREPQTAENASQSSSHVDQSRILVDVSQENRWTSRWSAKKTSSLSDGRVCNSLDRAAGTNVVVAEEAATPSRCDVIFGAFGASSSSLARENTRADSLAGIDVIASAAAWSSNRRNSFSHECCAEESESSSSVLPCSLQDVDSDGFAEIRPSYDGMGLVDNNIVIGSNTPRVAHVTDTDEWEMPAQTPLAFKSMVGQRVNGSSRNDFSCSLHEGYALTRTVEHKLVFDQEIATAAAALVSIPDMSDVLLSPGVHTAMSTLSRASQSPRNQGYLSTPDILRIVLTVLRSCEVMSSASGIVSVSKLVQLGLNVLQNVCLRESGCQVLYDVEDSVEVITTFLQFARYEAGIFEKVVHVLHNICSSGTRLQGLQKKFTIVDRILAVHELQQKNVKTYRKDVERLRRTEELLRELGGDIDVGGELTVPNSTLPDESVLSLLSEICVSLS